MKRANPTAPGAPEGVSRMQPQNTQITIDDYLPHIEDDRTARILAGLDASPKYLPSMCFYDDYGSELFEEITKCEDYYPTRTEQRILRDIASRIGHTFSDVDFVELGSGDCAKISILLDAVPDGRHESVCYVPFDVSRSAIEKSSRILLHAFPTLDIRGIVADFETQLHRIPHNNTRIFCFLGSTLGNLDRAQGLDFITRIGDVMLPDDMLLLGLDMVKPAHVLERAYNDHDAITARFNKNILRVVNDIAQTDFDPDDFSHVAFFNKPQARVEMHLEATRALQISTPLREETVALEPGERIHTENSHKFTREDIAEIASLSDLEIREIFTDAQGWFSVVQLHKPD